MRMGMVGNMALAQRKVLIMAADDFEDMELLYPLDRLAEENVEDTVAGLDDHPVRGKKGHGPVPWTPPRSRPAPPRPGSASGCPPRRPALPRHGRSLRPGRVGGAAPAAPPPLSARPTGRPARTGPAG